MNAPTNAPNLAPLIQQFYERYGQKAEAPQAFFAPGRVNLIGEHTDYTGGLVFPCAIDSGTVLLIRATEAGWLRLSSTNIDQPIELPLEPGLTYQQTQSGGGHWCNYPLGVIKEFQREGAQFNGLDCLFSGNIPNGSGLSSSASVEVVTAFALHQLNNTDHSKLDLALLAQRAENNFVGVPCGILDQFAVAMAEPDHAMMLTCASLDYHQVPLQLGEHSIVISNSNKRRELGDSAYKARVDECARALALVQQAEDINELAMLDAAMLARHAAVFDDDPIALQRARHVCSENERVRLAVAALERGDLTTMGHLMAQSHNSLRDDYCVSSAALDILVEQALQQEGVLGSRLTGAGFGGCTVSLVANPHIDAFIDSVGAGYAAGSKAIGDNLTANFYVSRAGGGVQAINLT